MRKLAYKYRYWHPYLFTFAGVAAFAALRLLGVV
jgi:hypothetical protein